MPVPYFGRNIIYHRAATTTRVVFLLFTYFGIINGNLNLLA